MRNNSESNGYLLCFILNLIFKFRWALAALALYVLHLWLGIPAWFSLICLGLWVLSALFYTFILSWAAESSSIPTPEQENKNPYSAKNPVYLTQKTPEIKNQDEEMSK